MFSSQNGTDSTNDSRSFTSTAIGKIAKLGQKMGLIEEIPTGSEAEKIVKKYNPFVRKLAHLGVYFVLGTLLMMALTPYHLPLWLHFMLTIMLCFGYSLTDEYHQTMVSGRNGTFMDCIIDTAGSMVAVLIYVTLTKNKKKS